jgi:hypothetical protein
LFFFFVFFFVFVFVFVFVYRVPSWPGTHPFSSGVRLQGYASNLSIPSDSERHDKLELHYLDKSQCLYWFVNPYLYTVRERSGIDSPVTFRRTFFITLNVRPEFSKDALGHILVLRGLCQGTWGETVLSHCIVLRFQ